ncbi:hypothetical protein [Pseudomonas orientalis]|uniref:Uncharacterized protein n=1 Tax=Pseudomonas orientalis TaxID=76758 RepID=A0A2L0RWU8_9PSED|nr:hypothetical protein [Pseudomonas orientalis]AUZ46585.1 hypothetical protein BOP93_13615 [Pseudomonas orientalis]
MPDQMEMLELILTAEVLTLGKAIRAERLAKKGVDPGDCTAEAIRDVKVLRQRLMNDLAMTRI